ncbi:MAG TPA: sugar transferase [Candidatus Paceibacterota bacterium]|nr:sugar transferase [Candidatus Paceibacterota bacterium]
MNSSRITTLLVGDTLCFAAALLLMIAAETSGTPQTGIVAFYAQAFAVPLFLFLIINYITNLYDIQSTVATPRSIGRFALAAVLGGGITALFFYIFPKFGISPKTNLVILAAGFFILLTVWRRIFFHLFARSLARRIFFIGESAETTHLQEALTAHPHLGTTVGIAKTLDAYLAADLPVDMLVIAKDIGVQEVERAAHTAVSIITVRGAFEELFGRIPLAHFTAEDAFSLLEQKSQERKTIFYRLFEIVIATSVLIISSPFLLVAALAILIEDGRPIFIQQKRVGEHGNIFTVYKFRSMKALAPDGSAEIAGAQWAEKKDNRRTKVGNILCTLHIDELPQMWNIIRGDIALVGPRPERPEFVIMLEKEIPFYFLRHAIKPGFTGWAQIKYRYARTIEDSREKFEYDLYYLRHRSLLLDIGILAKTIQIIFTH